MPVFFAGNVMGNATIRSGFGGGFSVTRYLAPVGIYRIIIPAASYSKVLIPTVTPVTARILARVMQLQRDASLNYLIDIELHDMGTNALVDGEFTFVALERSGP
jgi:hypothetical protein